GDSPSDRELCEPVLPREPREPGEPREPDDVNKRLEGGSADRGPARLTLHVDVNGRRYAVEVSARGGAFLVSIDGRQHEVDVKKIEGGLSLIVGTRSHDVAIAPGGADGTVVHVDGVPVEVVVAPSRPSWGNRGKDRGTPAQAGGPQRVTAPMPGKVVKLL